MRLYFAIAAVLLSTSFILAQQLLKDITPFNSSSEVTSPRVFNNKLYFVAFSDQTNSATSSAVSYNNDSRYNELWSSDGSSAGTSRLVTQNPFGSGPSNPFNILGVGTKLYYTARSTSSSPFYITDVVSNQTVTNTSFSHAQMLADVGGTVMFFGDYSGYGLELFKTNGTLAGTILVKDIVPGTGYTFPSSFIATSNLYYFVTSTSANGSELWRSDGTEAGTFIVKDINAGVASSNPSQLTVMNNEVYFTANDGSNGTELWKTNGTEAGTVMLKNINAGSASSSPNNLTVINNVLYFSASNGVNGTEMWTSAGTEATTILFKDINVGAASSSPQRFTLSGSLIYFIANNEASGNELWKTDGTAAETALVKDIRVGNSFDSWSTNSSTGEAKNPLQDVNGTLYFFTSNGSRTMRQLWKTDGTETNTVKISDLTTTSRLLSSGLYEKLFVTPTKVYYAAGDISGDYDIWTSDGTPNSAQLLRTTTPANDFIKGRPLITFNNELYFSAFDDTRGYELFKTNGTGAGTVLVKDINTAPASSKPLNFLELNGEAYFIANDVESGPNLFKSSGISYSTIKLGDLGSINTPGSFGLYTNNTNIMGLTATNGAVYFQQLLNQIWQTKGTTPPPSILVGPGQGVSTGDLSNKFYAVVNNDIFLSGDYGGTTSFELWKTDGTTTSLVKDINPSGGSFPQYLTAIGNMVYFAANTPTSGNELWKSDGTDAGTILVSDIVTGTSGSSPMNLTNVNGTLYFTATTSAHGRELWKSDGTSGGTTMVKDLTVGTNGSNIFGLASFGNKAIFRYNSALYVSDGTDAGTTTLTSNVGSVDPAVVENVIYFSKNGSLWKSDGTVAGTSEVAALFIGINNLTNINGTLYFLGKTTATGEELWRSDGTAVGTVMVADINPGSADSSPSGMTLINGKVYFSAYTSQYGREPWIVDHCPQFYNFVGGPSNISRNTLNYESSNNITANNKIVPMANVTYDAGKQIELLPGFSANTGTIFTAKIDGCGSSQPASVQFPAKKQMPVLATSAVVSPSNSFDEAMPTLEAFFNQPDGSLHWRRFTDSPSEIRQWRITKTVENEQEKIFLLEYEIAGKRYSAHLTLR